MAEAPWRQAAVPPPPPPGAVGQLPASRLKSEVSERRAEPPLCVQNAMLTKDKKPFTYTPGGIDLSEIRSPRMARRLERNAMNEGVSSVPQPQHHHPTGPLPPSALAAMQPQLSVQVFPTGGIPQLPHSGPPAPPPPPPPKAPPMKTSPLPTDCYDRPDMTKIIPDNPMALLRKTSGPIVKQDPILNKSGRVANNAPPQQIESPYQNVSPPKQVDAAFKKQISAEAPPLKPTSGVGSIYVPPVTQQVEPTPPTTYSPPAYYKRQPSTPQPEPPKPQPVSPDSPKPSLSKAPTPWLTQRRQNSQDVPEWAVNDYRVQSPPIQAEPQQQWAPPENYEPQIQSRPSRPWQQQQPLETPPRQQRQQQQQPEMVYRPQAVQREYQPEPQQWQPDRQPQQFWQEPQPKSPQIQKQAGGVRKQVQNREKPQEFNPVERTEVVVVNDPPLVYQHPGQLQQRVITRQVPYQQQQDPGVRIIPVQMEGRASNGQVRSPQHNRVLQKMTHTDGDDNDNQIVIEHSPKMHQQFPQRQVSMEQQRKWNSNDSDQVLMNSFKQGYDESSTLHNEVDPRYRGPNIPSKAFKLLQNMTGGPEQSPTTDVPQEQGNISGPKVRTIPIQIEGNGSVKNYLPPSEQTVQEPKKYMGSSIPSRSFKILQAMTAPDECGPGQSDL